MSEHSVQKLERDFQRLPEMERFERFVEFYLDLKTYSRSELLSLLLKIHTPLKMTFIRYLQEVPEAQALEWLLIFIGDSNQVIHENAQQAFTRNLYGSKNPILRNSIASPLMGTAIYSIRILSRLHDFFVLPKLINLIPNVPKEIQIEILRALRLLPDLRCVAVALEFAESSDEKLRYQAILTLSVLHKSSYPVSETLFLKCLKDPSSKVRQAALQALETSHSESVAQLFSEKAKFEKEFKERIRAIRGLSIFKRAEHVQLLVQLIAEEEDSKIQFAAENALRKFPSELLYSELSKLINHSDFHFSQRAAMIAAEILGTESEIKELIYSKWRSILADSEKIKWLEVFKHLDSKDTVNLILPQLNGSPLLQYSIINTLCHLRSFETHPQLIQILKDTKYNAVLKQALLDMLLKRGPSSKLKVEIFDWLKTILKSEVENIRYLGVSILRWYLDISILPLLYDLLNDEKEKTIYQTIEDLLFRICDGDPHLLLNVVEASAHAEKLTPLLCSVLEKGFWKQEGVDRLMDRLLNDPFYGLEKKSDLYLHLSCVLIRKNMLNPEFVWKQFLTLADKSNFLTALRKALADIPAGSLNFSLKFLMSFLSQMGDKEKEEFYHLSKSLNRFDSIALVVQVLLENQTDRTYSYGKGCLKHLLWSSPHE